RLARVAAAVLGFVRLTAAGIPHASWRRAGHRRRVVGPVRVGATSTQPRAGDGEEEAGKAAADLRHLARLHGRRPWTTTPASQREEVPDALLAGERRRRRPAVERIEFGSSRAASVTATARSWFSRCARRQRSSGRRGLDFGEVGVGDLAGGHCCAVGKKLEAPVSLGRCRLGGFERLLLDERREVNNLLKQRIGAACLDWEWLEGKLELDFLRGLLLALDLEQQKERGSWGK
ncbi:unnamed protein product, partial [Urochloa humidicola]